MSKYTIKPLEWTTSYIDSENECYSTHTVFGIMEVKRFRNLDVSNEWGEWHFWYCFDEYYNEATIPVLSKEDGIEKAEAHYLGCLLPALQKVEQ